MYAIINNSRYDRDGEHAGAVHSLYNSRQVANTACRRIRKRHKRVNGCDIDVSVIQCTFVSADETFARGPLAHPGGPLDVEAAK